MEQRVMYPSFTHRWTDHWTGQWTDQLNGSVDWPVSRQWKSMSEEREDFDSLWARWNYRKR